MARISLKYIAGFIDAEGSIGIWKRKRNGGRTIDWTPYISVVNTDKDIMMKISEILGGIIREKKHNRLGNKTIYSIAWTHKKARVVASKLYPYLEIKKGRAKIVMDFPACSGTFAPKNLKNKKAKQERLYNKMRIFMERGVA